MLIQEIDDYAFHLATILQYFKQQADAQNKPAEVPISALSNFMDKRGLDINPDTLKSLMTTDPVIKNLIKSFDGEKVTIDTVYEPDKAGDGNMDIDDTGAVASMAKRAMKRRE
jgi:hypothetical protein